MEQPINKLLAMPLFMLHNDSSCQWGIWNVTETIDELLELLPHSEVYRQQMMQFASSSRRLEWIAVRVLLFELLREEKEIAYNSNGRPYLLDKSLNISISHTRGFVSVIVAKPDKEVGIDIEQYSERVRRVAYRFVREDEELSNYDEADTTYSLLLHWSAKEVVFKCLNATDVDFLQHIRILPFHVAHEGILDAEEYRTQEALKFRIHYFLHSEFVLTWYES
jgi:Phosphopantetheinyl transferase